MTMDCKQVIKGKLLMNTVCGDVIKMRIIVIYCIVNRRRTTTGNGLVTKVIIGPNRMIWILVKVETLVIVWGGRSHTVLTALQMIDSVINGFCICSFKVGSHRTDGRNISGRPFCGRPKIFWGPVLKSIHLWHKQQK